MDYRPSLALRLCQNRVRTGVCRMECEVEGQRWCEPVRRLADYETGTRDGR